MNWEFKGENSRGSVKKPHLYYSKRKTVNQMKTGLKKKGKIMINELKIDCIKDLNSKAKKFVPMPEDLGKIIYDLNKNEILISYYLCKKFHFQPYSQKWTKTYDLFSLNTMETETKIKRNLIPKALEGLQDFGFIKYESRDGKGTIIILNTEENKNLDMDILFESLYKISNKNSNHLSQKVTGDCHKTLQVTGRKSDSYLSQKVTGETVSNIDIEQDTEIPKNIMKNIYKNYIKKEKSCSFVDSLNLDNLQSEILVSDVSNNKKNDEEKKEVPEPDINLEKIICKKTTLQEINIPPVIPTDILKSIPKKTSQEEIKDKYTQTKISMCIEKLFKIGFAKQDGVTEQKQLERIRYWVDKINYPDKILQAFEKAKEKGQENNPGYIRKIVEDPSFTPVPDDISVETSEKLIKESNNLSPISKVFGLMATGNSQKDEILFSILPKIQVLTSIKKSPMQYVENRIREIKNLPVNKFFTEETKTKMINNVESDMENFENSFRKTISELKKVTTIENFMNILSQAIDDNKITARIKKFWKGDKQKILNHLIYFINHYSDEDNQDHINFNLEAEETPKQEKQIDSKIVDFKNFKSNPVTAFALQAGIKDPELLDYIVNKG